MKKAKKEPETRSGIEKPECFNKYKETFNKDKVKAKICRMCPWAQDCKGKK